MAFEKPLSGCVPFNSSLILGSIIMNINCEVVIRTSRNILR